MRGVFVFDGYLRNFSIAPLLSDSSAHNFLMWAENSELTQRKMRNRKLAALFYFATGRVWHMIGPASDQLIVEK
jgi:hypothetical protein